jgi:hypothetical protein
MPLPVALELHSCGMTGFAVAVHEHSTSRGAGAPGSIAEGELSDAVRRAGAAYRMLEEQLVEAGGIESVVALYDRIRAGMQRLDYAQLDRVASEIRAAIEALLRMDAAVRKLNNLKVMFDGERRGERDGDVR